MSSWFLAGDAATFDAAIDAAETTSSDGVDQVEVSKIIVLASASENRLKLLEQIVSFGGNFLGKSMEEGVQRFLHRFSGWIHILNICQ